MGMVIAARIRERERGGHELEPGLVAGQPEFVNGAILGKALPDIIVDLMIVPGLDEGIGRARRLQVGVAEISQIEVAVVLKRFRPLIVEGPGLAAGRIAADPAQGAVGIHQARIVPVQVVPALGVLLADILIDEIADMQDEIDLAFGPGGGVLFHHRPVGGEIALLIILAGEDRDIGRLFRRRIRRGTGAPCPADRTVRRDEAVVEPLAARQVGDEHAHGVQILRRCGDGLAREHRRKVCILGNLDHEVYVALGPGHAGPQDEAVHLRVGRGDALWKAERVARTGRDSRQAIDARAGREDCAAGCADEKAEQVSTSGHGRSDAGLANRCWRGDSHEWPPGSGADLSLSRHNRASAHHCGDQSYPPASANRRHLFIRCDT